MAARASELDEIAPVPGCNGAWAVTRHVESVAALDVTELRELVAATGQNRPGPGIGADLADPGEFVARQPTQVATRQPRSLEVEYDVRTPKVESGWNAPALRSSWSSPPSRPNMSSRRSCPRCLPPVRRRRSASLRPVRMQRRGGRVGGTDAFLVCCPIRAERARCVRAPWPCPFPHGRGAPKPRPLTEETRQRHVTRVNRTKGISSVRLGGM
jgi:hypothetical protein